MFDKLRTDCVTKALANWTTKNVRQMNERMINKILNIAAFRLTGQELINYM